MKKRFVLKRHGTTPFQEFKAGLMNSIRDWMEVPFTRPHWKMVRNAITSQPYDYGCPHFSTPLRTAALWQSGFLKPRGLAIAGLCISLIDIIILIAVIGVVGSILSGIL